MKIFVDESGSFSLPSGDQSGVSCVAALVVPESQESEIYDKFKSIRKMWGHGPEEVKGRGLDEAQVRQVIDMLLDHDVFVEIAMIDMGLHSDELLTDHKDRQAELLEVHVDPARSPILAKNTKLLRQKLEEMSIPLYVQSWLIVEVAWQVLQKATIYYSQHIPTELSDFRWVVDAKDMEATPYEEYWYTVIASFFQTKSLESPVVVMDDRDYSHFERFNVERPPEYLNEYGVDVQGDGYSDATRILKESFQLSDSTEELGLQLADIVANAFRRAAVGNLQIDGWDKLGELMLRTDRSVNAIVLGRAVPTDTASLPYYPVLQHMDALSRHVLC